MLHTAMLEMTMRPEKTRPAMSVILVLIFTGSSIANQGGVWL